MNDDSEHIHLAWFERSPVRMEKGRMPSSGAPNVKASTWRQLLRRGVAFRRAGHHAAHELREFPVI